MEETKRYFEKALSRWKGCQLIGCIPYNSYLHAPAMIDYEKLFRRKICAGFCILYCTECRYGSSSIFCPPPHSPLPTPCWGAGEW